MKYDECFTFAQSQQKLNKAARSAKKYSYTKRHCSICLNSNYL